MDLGTLSKDSSFANDCIWCLQVLHSFLTHSNQGCSLEVHTETQALFQMIHSDDYTCADRDSI